jgi:hypothetical protein
VAAASFGIPIALLVISEVAAKQSVHVARYDSKERALNAIWRIQLILSRSSKELRILLASEERAGNSTPTEYNQIESLGDALHDAWGDFTNHVIPRLIEAGLSSPGDELQGQVDSIIGQLTEPHLRLGTGTNELEVSISGLIAKIYEVNKILDSFHVRILTTGRER